MYVLEWQSQQRQHVHATLWIDNKWPTRHNPYRLSTKHHAAKRTGWYGHIPTGCRWRQCVVTKLPQCVAEPKKFWWGKKNPQNALAVGWVRATVKPLKVGERQGRSGRSTEQVAGGLCVKRQPCSTTVWTRKAAAECCVCGMYVRDEVWSLVCLDCTAQTTNNRTA